MRWTVKMRIISLGAANNKNRMHDYEGIDKRQNEIIKLNILVDVFYGFVWKNKKYFFCIFCCDICPLARTCVSVRACLHLCVLYYQLQTSCFSSRPVLSPEIFQKSDNTNAIRYHAWSLASSFVYALKSLELQGDKISILYINIHK